ncbi:MAG TPA: hypothetical protein VHZ96_14195 [Frankiaceae bacterium]|nr:hypothetical protein [Frankiaceae bacterium]
MTGLTRAHQVADAVLYEGYLLYPYRASSPKNQVRWQFGVLGPPGAAEAGVGEPATMSTELSLESADIAFINVYVRFLQVQSRVVERCTDKGWQEVDELTVGGTRWIPFHEAVSREVPLCNIPLDALDSSLELSVSAPAGDEFEELCEGSRVVGRLIRRHAALHGTVTLTSRPGTDPRLTVLTVAVQNNTWWSQGDVPGATARDVAARYSFVGTHLLLTAQGTRFLSLLEGPDWTDADVKTFSQSRCWPVLIETDEGSDAVLVAPIILGDHPSIAPESAGDLFDATEIDEILTLRVMTMTEQEKAEARGTDPRAAAILARCDAMTPDELAGLHGAQRPTDHTIDLSDVPVFGELTEDEIPWWDEGQDARAAPTTDCVVVKGIPVAKGSRVLLRPSRQADAQDLFLAGMTALVQRVYFDVDGDTHVAVVLEDDPGRDLYDTTGRFYYFAPEEVEPLT